MLTKSKTIVPQKIILILVISASTLSSKAQPLRNSASTSLMVTPYFHPIDDSVKFNGAYVLGMFKDTWFILKSPVRWKGKDWMKFGVVSGVTAFFIWKDEDITDWVKKNRSDPSNTVSDIFEPLGRDEITMPYSAVVGFYLFGAIKKDYKAKKAALLAMESYLIAGLFTQILKRAIGRERPFSESSKSFPSGHTTSVFAISSVIASEYRDKKWLPPVLYGISALTSISRVNDLKHWSSDVFFGFAMGYFMGQTISRLHSKDPNIRISLSPVLIGNNPVMGVVYRF